MKVTDATERLKICRGCGSYNPVFIQCKSCGCFLIVKAKFKGQDCPEGKWEKPDEKESLDIS
jgi:hypothetical protein